MNLDKNIETFEFLSSRWPLKDIVKSLLVLNKIESTKLADEMGVKRGSMSMTIGRKRNHPRAMAAISRKLGIPARELFDGKAKTP